MKKRGHKATRGDENHLKPKKGGRKKGEGRKGEPKIKCKEEGGLMREPGSREDTRRKARGGVPEADKDSRRCKRHESGGKGGEGCWGLGGGYKPERWDKKE